MLQTYDKKIEEISEMYKQANNLVVLFETYNKVGNLSFVYQLKDAHSHLMDAIDADIKLKSEENQEERKELQDSIAGELEGCRKHLFRLIFDAGEALIILLLNHFIKIFDRYPKFLISEIYPNMNEDTRPRYLSFLSQLSEFKNLKAVTSKKELSDKVYKLAIDVEKFVNEGLEKNNGYKWRALWKSLLWLATVFASGVAGALVTELLQSL